jgi:hypothetical protein
LNLTKWLDYHLQTNLQLYYLVVKKWVH